MLSSHRDRVLEAFGYFQHAIITTDLHSAKIPSRVSANYRIVLVTNVNVSSKYHCNVSGSLEKRSVY